MPNPIKFVSVAQFIGEGHPGGHYFLVEQYLSCDGPRMRICEGRWPTFEEADAQRKLRKAK